MASRHPNATTTTEQRKLIQNSPLTVSELANTLGVSERTVRRWKARKTTEDASHTPHRLPNTLTEEQQWFLIAVHKMLRLTLDDLLCVARTFVLSTTSRSALYRSLARDGETNITDPLSQYIRAKVKPRRQLNKPGIVEIRIRRLPDMPENTAHHYVLVAQDCASRWAYIEIQEHTKAVNVIAFLKNVKAHFPFQIRVLLIEQHLRMFDKYPLPKEAHLTRAPTEICNALALPHLELMRISNELCTDSDKLFRNSSLLTNKATSVTLLHNFKMQLDRFTYWYNHRIPQRAIKNLTPYSCLQAHYKTAPKLFIREPLQPFVQTHFLKIFIYDVFYALKLINEHSNPEGIKQTRKGHFKNTNDFKAHQDMFGTYMPLLIDLMSGTTSGFTPFRYSVLEHLYLEVSSIPIITLKSEEEVKDCYVKHVLIPIIAIIIHKESIIERAESFFYHIHKMLESNFDNETLSADNLHVRIKLYLRQYIQYLDLNENDIAKKIARNIKNIGPGRMQTADTILGMFEFRKRYENDRAKIIANALPINEKKCAELTKLLKLNTAYLAMSLLSRLESQSAHLETLVHCYHKLLSKDEQMLCLQYHLQNLFFLPNLTGDLGINKINRLGDNYLKRQFAPLVNLLHTPVRHELSVDTIQENEQLINQLKDLVSNPHKSHLNIYDRAIFKPITDIDKQDGAYRTVFIPYAYLISIINCIQDGKLDDAYKLADDAPYGACEQFSFLAYAFSMLYVGLHFRLNKGKLSNSKLTILSHYIIAGQGLITTCQKSPIAISQLINSTLTNESHNNLTSSPNNISIMRAIYAYNQLTLKLTCTSKKGYGADPIPQAIYGMLDRLYHVSATLTAELNNISPNASPEQHTEIFMNRTTLTEDDLHGDLIPFLKDSSFINCMSENLFLIEHLCGPSMGLNDVLAISQFASQQQNMARLYDHLRSKARDSFLGVTVN
ncbi:hypothetical protein [Aeromonas sp. s5]|uniref:hypothetical protein n=1 Tax=Aeromonas sp. s5 TaxID=3138487 RepID=UPI0034A23D92